MNGKNCAEIATNKEYIENKSGVKYRINPNAMTRLKDKNKVQVEE